MKQTMISQIDASYVGKQVELRWWIEHVRGSGKIIFVELRDGSGYMQCVVEQKMVDEQQFEQLKACGIESSLLLRGEISKHPKKEEYELQTKEVEVITVSKDYPLGQKEHGVEFLFDHRHLHLRTKRQVAIQRVRDTIIHATYDWMRDNGFTKIDAPIFTPTSCEDTTELYEVEHTNGKSMYLSQSWQLYIEAAVPGHGRVYDFGPCFRAEKTKTRRHLNELWMMDAEMPFMDYKDNMEVQEQLVFFILQEVLRINRADLETIGRDITKLEKIELPFPRKTHAEIVTELQAMGSDIEAGHDLGGDDEEMLMNKYEQPLFITHYPKDVKAFYMPEDPEHPGTVKCSDLLAPEWYGEVIGGSERESDYETLKKKILEEGFDLEDWSFYLDIRKYGGVKTSGFGFGLERLVRWICGVHHIRECIPFPRYHNRITP